MSASNGAASTSSQKAERRALIFKRDEVQQSAEDAADDSFYNVTADDIRKMHAHLQEQVRLHTHRALVPAAYVAQKNKERKTESYPHTVIRFSLPNRVLIQAQFNSLEPASNVFDFVRELLRDKSAKFSLRIPPIDQVPNVKDKDLIDVGLAPKSHVVLKLSTTADNIDEILDTAQATECTEHEANNAAKEWLSSNMVFRPFNPLIPEENQAQKRVAEEGIQPPPQRQQPTTSGGSLPKWLRR